MNNLSPTRIALRASLLTGMMVFGLIALFSKLSGKVDWITASVVSLIAAGFVFYLFQYLIRNFISNRIQGVYKAIHNLKLREGEEVRLPGDPDDLIVQLNREVSDWAKNRANEIEDLKKLETYRREFLGNVSHELKTPIFNIQGYLETLLDGGLEDPNINRNYLQRAEKSVERMIAIIGDLEAISRLESGELEIDPTRFDIVQLVRDVFEAQEIKAAGKNISLRFKENYKPIEVFADKERIRQVITNLVVNSIKYGKENGESEARFYDMRDQIMVELSDNGIGIGKEHLPRLFERFYRVDKGRSRDQGGTGLGLAIVKHILEAHEQGINVRSSEGIGTAFSFTLQKNR